MEATRVNIQGITVEFDGARPVRVIPGESITIEGDNPTLYRQELKFLADLMQMLRDFKDQQNAADN